MADWIFKVIVAGSGGVGKTALVERYCTGTFLEDHKMTIGAAFSLKDVTLEDHNVKMQLWDFAGEERFRMMLESYCLGAVGALICYDITDYATFEALREWIILIRKGAGNIPIILVGNKYDLPNHEVEEEVAEQYSVNTQCIGNVFCSSKSGVNVEETFTSLSKWMIYNAQDGQQ